MKLNKVKYFTNNDWIDKDKSTRMDLFKELIYVFIRPLLSRYSSRYLTMATLRKHKPYFVLPGRGIPYRTRRHWVSRLCHIKDATILVQGVGYGWEVLSWAKMRPKKIIGVDLFSFSETWDEISQYCQEKYNIEVEFQQASLESLSFLENCSINICVSDAVYEHCRDLNSVLKESFRVLKPGGVLYAAYGPLWFSAGGDHFSVRAGLQNSFNHLILNQKEYMKFVNYCSCKDEEYQGGRRYIEIDLFSKLTTQEYLELLKINGFKIDKMVIETNSRALAFKKQYPEKFSEIVEICYGKCDADDLIIQSNIVFCIKY